MKKLSLIGIFALVSVSMLLITCKKEDDNKVQSCIITKMAVPVTGADTSYYYYTYDAGKKLIKMDMGSGLYTTYTYETNKVTGKSYVNNALSYTEVFTLNSDQQVISSTYALAGAAVSKNITYEYNADGYLVSKVTALASDINKTDTYAYEYENGNLTYETHDYSYDNLPSTDKTYEYYTDKANNLDLKVGFMGKKSANLLKKSVYTVYSATNSVITTSYTYEFGTDGKVKKQIMSIGTGSMTFMPFYECE